MFANFFKKKKIKEEVIFSPIQGDVVSLTDVPDPVFSQKMLGDGLAILPSNGNIVSPVNGKVMQVFPTKHAIGIQTKNGIEILIHIGLDTVELNGEGFECLVNNNQLVEVGDPLVKVNLDYLKNNNKNTITPIIVTNSEAIESMKKTEKRKILKGENLFKYIVK